MDKDDGTSVHGRLKEENFKYGDMQSDKTYHSFQMMIIKTKESGIYALSANVRQYLCFPFPFLLNYFY